MSSRAYDKTSRSTTDTSDRRKRTTSIPAPATMSTASTAGRRQTPKKLSKAQPSSRSAVPTRSNVAALPQYSISTGALLNPPATLRTPSLVSGSSISTFESPRSIILRRKPSTIGKYVAERSQTSSVTYHATADDSVFGISMPTILGTTPPPLLEGGPRFPSQAESTQWRASQLASLSSLGITTSDTPSTRFTESPFSHVEAPSSCSSVSPSLATAGRMQNFKDAISGDRHHTGTPHTQSSIGSIYRPHRSSIRSSFAPSVMEISAKNVPPRTESASSRTPHASALLASPDTGLRSPSRASLASNASKQSKQSRIALTPNPRVPPELAHLNESAVPRPPQGQSTQSRHEALQLAQQHSSLEDGCHILAPLAGPTYSRPESRDSLASSSGHSFRERFGLTSRSLSKLSHRSDRAAESPKPVVHSTLGSVQTAESSTREVSHESKTITQKPSRFGFLRKGKDNVAQTAEKPKREARKGPAAGTGHERYGKFGFRGRSSSNTSNPDSRSPSTSSQKSGFSDRFLRRKDSSGTQDSSDMDDFLKERLKPKVLRGSGSNFSSITSPSIYSTADDRDGSALSRVPTSQSQACDVSPLISSTAVFPFLPSSPVKLTNGGVSRSNDPPMNSEEKKQMTLGAPSVDQLGSRPTTAQAHKVNGTSKADFNRKDPEEGFWLRPTEPLKKPASRWNFLQRVRSSPQKSKPTRDAFDQLSTNTDHKRHHFDNAAHYALLDAVEPVTLAEVEEMVSSPTKIDGYTSPTLSSEVPTRPHSMHRDVLLPPGRTSAVSSLEQSIHFTEPTLSLSTNEQSKGADMPSTLAMPQEETISQPVASTSEPTLEQQHFLVPPTSEQMPGRTVDLPHTPNLSQDQTRQPRLSPVGRIPQVKSGRAQERKPPPVSFSRPFAYSQPRPSIKPPGTLYSQIREAASPIIDSQEPMSVAPLAVRNSSQSQQPIAPTSQASSKRDSTMSTTYPGFSMFSLPSRKNSDFSYSSSSDTTSYTAFALNQAFEQEDVWHEYNDLLDEVILDQPVKPSRRSSTTCSARSAIVNTSLPHFKDRGVFIPNTIASPPPEQALPSPPRHNSSKAPSIASSLADKTEIDNVARSRYRDGISSATAKTKNEDPDAATSSRDSQISSRSRSMFHVDADVRSSHTSFSSGADIVRRSRVSIISVDDEGKSGVHPAVNVNFDALMTSKWLSFGRVLFSPAHNETRLADDPRILILDGLSDEWSYFVALTYPQATVYNLDMTSRSGTRKPKAQSLPNHRKIYHAAVGAPLPFPKGFFTAAVFRFPVATTDHAYHTAIAEFKRVLRPGGYLEISVLDIDLRGMGSIARKAVRGLKTRMQQQQESVSLRSLGDFLLQSIGKRGFEEVQRCIVGVPVVSQAVPSGELRVLLSAASNANSLAPANSANAQTATERSAESADTVEDSCESCFSEESDDKMTRTVARVGRWWYSMCYERAVPKTDQSIWKNEALLQECYDQGTSFQMLMCHAQKPVQLRRHTRSV